MPGPPTHQESLLLPTLEQRLARASPEERANVAADLGAILQRLDAGEYASTDFLVRNVFDVPKRTREFFSYMQGYARLSQRLAVWLGPLLTPESRTVLDLCPGWVPKVPLALHQLQFRGQLVIVNKDSHATSQLMTLAHLLAPSVAIVSHQADMFQSPPAARADVVLANHLVDDALVDFYGPQLGISAEDFYENEPSTRAAWGKLLSMEATVLKEFPPRLARALAQHCTPGGLLLVSQYPGYMEQLLQARDASTLFAQVLGATVELLLEQGFVRTGGPSAQSGTHATLRAP